MITLERVRLVLWHFFEDEVISIGNRCLIAGDNGSGKSTIVDAIQYALAADLRKARFNSAAGDRKGGRDLAGYARCKLGSDVTEYLRGDAISWIMLEFSDNADGFLAAVCVEAYSDGRTAEHFWIAGGMKLDSVEVRAPDGRPLSFRQARDALAPRGAEFADSKKQYIRELTSRLGVFRRMAEYNPYLEAFTRSVSFTPLSSVDRFVCDYILEDRPLDISTMKANLESYKEAEREAIATKRRISFLTRIDAQAEEYRKFRRIQTQQEYLKILLDRNMAKEALENGLKKDRDLVSDLARLESSLADTSRVKAELVSVRRETETALARDDAHLLFTRMKENLADVTRRLSEAFMRAARYGLLRSQCAALLDRSPAGDLDEEISFLEEAQTENTREGQKLSAEKERIELLLRETFSELADLDRGIRRYPESPARLRDACKKDGIEAWILSDLTEVLQADWADAVEGWLNTLRFAVIVAPENFTAALTLYNSLPRTVSGAALPNLAKMRGMERRAGSLAELVGTESPYAKLYLDCVLGDVMTSDLSSLKNYSKAVTKDCMCYSRFTAARIDEKVYRDHWLGQTAREKRKSFLLAETIRLRAELEEVVSASGKNGERSEILRRSYRSLNEARSLFPSVAEAVRLEGERIQAERDLESIDTETFRDLEARIGELTKRIDECESSLACLHRETGAKKRELEDGKNSLVGFELVFALSSRAFDEFIRSNEAVIADCEKYASERLRSSTGRDIIANYASARKGIDTKSEKCLKDFRELVMQYDNEFNALLHPEIDEAPLVRSLLDRLASSELPEYLEKISKARQDAEREFKDHFISRLNELIEEARESFREINETLRVMTFGRDQYRFTLEERSDRRGQIDIVRKAAEIATFEDSLFAQFADPADREAAEALFDRILHSSLDSPEMRSICDYRTYFTYDIRMKDTQSIDPSTGKAEESSLSRVLREKSGGEAQTPYYVAIAASFYRFFKEKREITVRLVLFDEAFDRLDDDRIGKILEFYREMGLQTVISVPTEKIESIAPHMDRVNLVIRHGYRAAVRDFHFSGSTQ